MATTQVCISQSYSDALRNQFHQSQTEQIIVFILSPFVYISAIINISFFLRGKKRTQPPADILLFVTIFGIIRITSYLAGSIYDSINPPTISSQQSSSTHVPDSFRQFCDGTGFLNVMCQVAHFVYNVVFCVYYIIKIRNPLKSWIKDNKQVHIFCLVVIIGATLIFYLTSLIGVSILGVCGYRFGSGSIYIDTILTCSYFLTTIISSIFFLKYLRSISKLQKSTRIYFKYYFKYLIISSLVYLIGVVSLVVVTVKCLSDQNDDLFDGLVIVCNVSRIISPIMVLCVIVGHPQLRLANFYRYFAKLCKYSLRNNSKKSDNNNDNSQQQPQSPLPIINHHTSFFPQPLSSPKRTSILIELTTLNNPHKNKLDYLSRMKDRNKACLLNTILGCLALQEIQYREKLSFLSDTKDTGQEKFQTHPTSIRIEDLTLSAFEFQNDNQQIYGWNFNQTHEFQLNEQIIISFNQVFTQKLPTLNIKFISFSSSVFKKLQKRQKINNLYQKILPSNNQKQILQNVDNDGGRSGQFFFFNFDKNIIIKTITNMQLAVLRERMEAYFYYLEGNKQSLIVKILGLYKAVNPQTQEQISFMLMCNILKDIPKKYILKSYDMKGSTHQRQVLKDKQIRQSNEIKTSKTLKDIDFHILQGKVHISQQDSQKIKKIISQDVAFLCSQGLIDYSLILLKLNYKKLMQQQPNLSINGLKMYHSTKQQGIVYIFGIIDYLQTWNIRKKGQKWYKSIFNKQQSISSQDPQFYAQRFMKNLVAMILP